MQTIKLVLENFCSLSRQSINHTKSKILFSKNCHPNTMISISNMLGIKKSNIFGTYLGFPILSKNPKPADYQFIIDKMRTSLASWKMRFMNIAGRTTFTQSCLNSIPNYYMQYTLLPKRLLKLLTKSIWTLSGSRMKTGKKFILSIGQKYANLNLLVV